MKAAARQLRQRSTRTEVALWNALRGRRLGGFRFRRQQPIGTFVVDFYCSEARMAIEIDGSVHLQHLEYDHQRQQLIETLGVTFLRFSAAHVASDLPKVLEAIRLALPPFPLPPWERGRG